VPLNRRLRLGLLAAGALVALLAVIAAALPFLVDVNRYRPTIEAKIEEALGRDVRLGAIRLGLLPPSVRVDGLAIAALPDEGGGDLVSAASLRVGVRLLPLLSKRLEVTGIVIDHPVLLVERRADGAWNVQRLVAPRPAVASPPPSTSSASAASFSVDTLRLVHGEVTLRVPAASGGQAELKLSDLDLTLANVGLDRVLEMKMEARPSIAPKGKLSLSGTVGPLQPGAADVLRLDATLRLDAIPPAALAKWSAALGGPSVPAGLLGDRPAGLEVHLTAESARGGGALRAIDVDRLRLADLDLVLARGKGGRWNYAPLLNGGTPPASRPPGPTLALSGLAIENAHVRIQDDAGPGKRFDQTIDRLDLTLDRLPTAGPAKGEVALQLAGTDIKVGGTVDASGRRPRVDLTLAPTRISAEGLRSLLVLAGSDVPLSFEAAEPIEIEARVTGEVGEGHTPDLNGKLTLRGFSFQHPSMKEPLRDVHGTLTLAGQTIEIRGFQARMGESDLSGDVTVTGLHTPKVRFDLRSRRADFWQLMSFVGGSEGTAAAGSGTTAPAASGAFLTNLSADGTLRIEEGSFQKLDFTGLDARMRLDGQVITLEPFTMSLYGGKFDGSATLDLGVEPTSFHLRTDAKGIDLDPLLADNLDLAGLFSGRFQGALEARGTGTSYDAIVRSLTGGGSVAVTDGAVGKLDILGILSRATDVFGEQTLNSLSRKLEKEGTPFSHLSGTLTLGGGKLQSRDLRLESPDIVLAASGSADLLAAAIDFDAEVLFSSEISASMQKEGSRAAQAFWDPHRGQVNLPLRLSGPFASPSANINWGTAGRNLAQRKAEDALRDRLGDKAGGLAGLFGKKTEAPAPASAAPAAPPPDPAALDVEISRARVGGSLLSQDLKIEGIVRGASIDRATLIVTDAAGNEIERVERLQEIVNFLAAAADRSAPASIRWDHTVNARKIAAAKSPLTVRVVVTDAAGKTAEAKSEVRK
jgi:AsmA protein